MKLRLLVLLAGAAAGLLATSAAAKDGVEATLETTIPLDTRPGEVLTVAWRLASVDAEGRRQPFGAGGVFIRLLSASGGQATEAVANGTATGRYEASVVVPEGGIGGLRIGLHGTSHGPSGSEPSDVFFPLTDDPVGLTPLGTPADPTDEEAMSGWSAMTWTAALAPVFIFAVGGFALLLRRQRRYSAGRLRT